jgi:hypothetical protein
MGVRGVRVRLAGSGWCIQPIGCTATGVKGRSRRRGIGDKPAPGLPGVGEEPVPGTVNMSSSAFEVCPQGKFVGIFGAASALRR